MQREVQIAGQAYTLGTCAFGKSSRLDAEFLRQFNQIFGGRNSQAWLKWKYQQDQVLACSLQDNKGKLAANWSGFPRILNYGDHRLSAVQNGDVFVVQTLRAILTRHGPLSYVSNCFLDEYVGEGKKFTLAFGFPNTRHMMLLLRLGLFADLFEMQLLRWKTDIARKSFGSKFTRLHRLPSEDWLNSRCSIFHASRRDMVTIERTAAYLLWRYWRNPEHEYIFFNAKPHFGAEPTLVILRKMDDELLLVDLIGPLEHVSRVIALLVSYVLGEYGKSLIAWASPLTADKMPRPTQVGKTGAHFAYALRSSPSPSIASTMGWWLLAGDTDFL